MIPLRDEVRVRTFPFITLFLIVLNVTGFLLEIALGSRGQLLVQGYGATPYELTHRIDLAPAIPFPLYTTLVTSMFLHSGFIHIFGNMLYLWIFGDNVEDAVGHLRFLTFYLLCGSIASAAHIMTDPNSTSPMIGASGAISSLLGAYLVLHPRARILTLVPLFFYIELIRVPAWFFLIIWIGIQIFNGTLSMGSSGGVAWFAHMGGFFAGMLLIFLFKKPRVRTGWRKR